MLHDDDNDDVIVLNGQASYTVGLHVQPRMVHLRHSSCFTSKKSMLYLDLSAQRVSYVGLQAYTTVRYDSMRYANVLSCVRKLQNDSHAA